MLKPAGSESLVQCLLLLRREEDHPPATGDWCPLESGRDGRRKGDERDEDERPYDSRRSALLEQQPFSLVLPVADPIELGPERGWRVLGRVEALVVQAPGLVRSLELVRDLLVMTEPLA